jgi:hypothetical protein
LGATVVPPVYPKILENYAVKSTSEAGGDVDLVGVNFEVKLNLDTSGYLSGTVDVKTAAGERKQFKVREGIIVGGVSHSCEE